MMDEVPEWHDNFLHDTDIIAVAEGQEDVQYIFYHIQESCSNWLTRKEVGLLINLLFFYINCFTHKVQFGDKSVDVSECKCGSIEKEKRRPCAISITMNDSFLVYVSLPSSEPHFLSKQHRN